MRIKKFLILSILLLFSVSQAALPTRFTEVEVREGLTVTGTSTLTGAVSLGSTLAADSILEKTAANGVSIDVAVKVKDGAITMAGALTGVTTQSNSGTHTYSGAAANIALGANYLSGDGGDEGVYVASDGHVGIGTANPTEQFYVESASDGQVAIFSAASGSFAEINLQDDAGSAKLARWRTNNGVVTLFANNATEVIEYSSTQVTTNVALDVVGALDVSTTVTAASATMETFLRLTPTNTTPSTTEGNCFFKDSEDVVKCYGGAAWNDLW